MVHHELGSTVLDRVKDETEELCKIEVFPKIGGKTDGNGFSAKIKKKKKNL